MRDFAIHQAEFSGSLPQSGYLGRIWRNWTARRAVASLDRLDDFLLQDIGVTRDEVRRAAHSPLSENAALVLEDISRNRELRFGRERFAKAARPSATISPIRVS
jgi:uncharacterized protein YjiS (DUF1127 family)